VIGVLAGGVLTQSIGWRWVFFVNLPVCALVLAGAFRLLANDGKQAPIKDFDAVGAVLSTAGMLGVVYALVNAPTVGWAARARSASSLVRSPPSVCSLSPSCGIATHSSRSRSSASRASPRSTRRR
jgi:MFS family permease